MKPKEQSFLAIGNIRDDGIECIGIATRLFGFDCQWNCHLTLLLPVPQDTLLAAFIGMVIHPSFVCPAPIVILAFELLVIGALPEGM